jgi:eukaryotic-like serine/threonine-protein kinase
MATTGPTVSVDERTRLAETRLGQVVLGKWRLERLIGIGGMAAVFEAAHHNGNRVAIKMLHADLACREEMRGRFLAEAYAANRVAHPGVVAVRDEGTTEDGAVFLVMDLLRGQTLAERLEARAARLSVREALEIAEQLLDILVHAHDRGIVHRDIKPQNVFLTLDGRARLLDFGIARVDSSARALAIPPGTSLGTPAFMSPEQALGSWHELDGRSDLWSLGATLYLLLSGVPVREPGSATDQLLEAMTRPAPSLGDVATLPRSLVAIIDRALAFEPDERFPDARSMQLALRAVKNELSAPNASITLPPASLEPVALSIAASRLDARRAPPRASGVSPASAIATPLPGAATQPGRSALPLYISLGFAVGMSIVVAARCTVQRPPHATLTLGPEPAAAVGHAPATPPSVATLPPSPSASALPSSQPSQHPGRLPAPVR